MAHHIFPTENNVGTTDGYPSRDLREKSFVAYTRMRGRSRLDSFVTWSMTLSAGSGLSVNVAAGFAIINGFKIESDAVENLAGLTASNTNYIWAALTKDGNGLVTGYALSANTTGTPPTDSVLLGIAKTDGVGIITGGISNSVPNPSNATGTYTGDGQTNRTIFLGFQPKYVIVFLNSGGGIQVGFSGIAILQAGLWAESALTSGAISGATYNYHCPLITAFGFSVGHHASLGSLNYSGATYKYVAFI